MRELFASRAAVLQAEAEKALVEKQIELENLRQAEANKMLLEALKLLYVKLTPQLNGADEHCYVIGMRKQVTERDMNQVVAAIAQAERTKGA
jgi:hypothetical protein